MRVRTIPGDEIEQIVSDPEDAKSPRYYLRCWTEQWLNEGTGRINNTPRKAYYPDWKFKPETKPAKLGSVPVIWDAPVYHVKTGGFAGWKFGVSEVYAAIDWARAYKEFLEDWASLTRSYSKFAFKLTTPGGKKGVSAAKTKLNSTLGDSPSNAETNPASSTGGVFVAGEGVDLSPMQLRGANISADDGRRLLLMVASAVGYPETYFGDVSVGSLATAKTMDRPTELNMRERQIFWTDILNNIFGYVKMKSVEFGDLAQIATIVRVPDGASMTEIIVWNEGVDPHTDIDFPPILTKDSQTAVQAIVTAATLNGQAISIFDEQTVARLLLSALAQDDVDEIMNDLYPDDGPSLSGNEPAAPSEARILAAAKALVEAMKKNAA